MLALSVRIGQAVKIGEHVIVHVGEKSGRVVRLAFDTAEAPIKVFHAGEAPRLPPKRAAPKPAPAAAAARRRRRATWGLTGKPRPFPK